jgi:hypothetical protein
MPIDNPNLIGLYNAWVPRYWIFMKNDRIKRPKAKAKLNIPK